MRISLNIVRELITALGFLPEDGRDNIYYKKYSGHDGYIVRVNFNTEKIEYREDSIDDAHGITWGDTTTSNFENSENFVVLECVNRLLEKGYAPNAIALEKKYPLGRKLKGKLDIIVSDHDGKSYLMIECKTWGTEYIKEYKKMVRDGAQLFSYFANDRTVKYLCLYASQLNDKQIEYKNDIVPVEEDWAELANVKEIHDHWNKNFKDNGIFEEWAIAYNIEIKALVRGRLQPLTKDDSGRIFNQFAEILRHNVVSDKPNAFNKILNLFICKIIDEDKNEDEQVDFQWLEDDSDESLQVRLNDLYKKGMHRFLEIEVTDYSYDEISGQLANISDKAAFDAIKGMLTKLRLQKNPEFAFIEVYNDQSFKTNARIVREVVELLQPYQFRYGHKQQFLGDFFELLLNTSIKQEAGQFFTPVPICRYIVSSLPIKEFILNKLKSGDPDILPSVIDFACGTGHFLTEYMDRVQSVIEEIDISVAKPSIRKKLNAWRDFDKYDWAKEYVYGIDADYRLVKSSKVSSFLNGDGEANIIRANGLDSFSTSKDYKGRLRETNKDNPQDNGQFDILIANPPYSVSAFKSTVQNGEDSFELFNRLTDNSSEIECLFVERMKQLLKVGGYAGIILPSSILSNAGIYTAAREIILKYFKIKGITELGSNTFMATGTNTVILFLERRSNLDHKQIQNAINSFFDRPKETTVLGIEKAFSKYVEEVFDGISFDDYISFVTRKANDAFKSQEIWTDYLNWFNGLLEIAKLKDQKLFKEKSASEQNAELEKMFYSKVHSIEKEKILYFLLTYSQETVIVKVGEKQAEKEFLGYEFSNRRGHEGIKMLPVGTQLYDEANLLNSEKANSYIHHAFLEDIPLEIDESIENNITVYNTHTMIDFEYAQFDKRIHLNANRVLVFDSKYSCEKMSSEISLIRGITYDKNNQVYNKTSNAILTADNISIENGFDISKIIYLNEHSILADTAKLSKDDIFICMSSGSRRHVGKVAYVKSDMEYYAGGFMGILRYTTKNLHSRKFLMEYIYIIMSSSAVRRCFSEKALGANIKNLDDTILNIKVPCPPLDVQEIIVEKTDAIENRISTLKEKISDLSERLLVPAYFSYSTERIDTMALMVQRGKSPSYGKSKTQIIKSGQARGYLSFDFSRKYFVSDDYISDERNLQKGDILINSTGVGTAGRVTLFDFDGDFVVDSHITIVRLNQDVAMPKYVLYALANIGFKNIEKMANGQSGQIELAPSTINGIQLPLPSIEDQRKIIAQIEPIEKEIDRLEREISSLDQQKSDILQNYLL